MQMENEGHPLPPPALEIDGLGTLQISDRTMAVLLCLERDLTPEDRATDDVIVRKFVACAASVKGPDEVVTKLSDAQVDSISTDDLERFALLCLEREDWSPSTEPESVDASATGRLAARLRQELKGEPIAWAGKDYLARAGFSDNTLRLLAESQKLSCQLKRFGAVADLDRISSCNSLRGIEAALKAAKNQSSLAGLLNNKYLDRLKVSPAWEAALKAANSNRSEIPAIEIPRSLLKDDLVKPLPNVGKQIGDKVDQVGEILGDHMVKLSVATDTIAQLHDTTNKALISAIGDFKAQADKNERSARNALRVAAISLVVSAGIAVAAYHQDGKNNEANDRAQEAMLQLLSEQRSQLERISKANELQTKALLDLNGPDVLRAPAQPKRDSLKLPPK
jgi:hypothetical protein